MAHLDSCRLCCGTWLTANPVLVSQKWGVWGVCVCHLVYPIFCATKTGVSPGACLLVTKRLQQEPSSALKHMLRFLSSKSNPRVCCWTLHPCLHFFANLSARWMSSFLLGALDSETTVWTGLLLLWALREKDQEESPQRSWEQSRK